MTDSMHACMHTHTHTHTHIHTHTHTYTHFTGEKTSSMIRESVDHDRARIQV